MKNVFLSCLTILFLFHLPVAQAQSSTAADIARLKAFSISDIKADQAARARKIKAPLKIDSMFESLESIVDSLVKENRTASPELIKELCRVALLTFQDDPSLYAAEVLASLYEKDRKAFEKGARLLNTSQSKEILDAVKMAVREKTEGNG